MLTETGQAPKIIFFGLKMIPSSKSGLRFLVTFISILIIIISLYVLSKHSNHANEILVSSIYPLPRPDHVVIVIEENNSYKGIIGNIEAPYINQLANEGALFTNSFAITHPSQPNYLALFSGSTHGIKDDRCLILSLSGDNLANQLLKKGLSFAIYSESMPSIGFDKCASENFYYERKHNPAANWQNNNIPPEVNMPFEIFPSNFMKLPTVSIVIPNQNNDMHGLHTELGLVRQSDNWLKSNLDAYLQWAKTNNSLLIITWDEDDGSDNNHIPTIFIGPMVKSGQYSTYINHYTVLRTMIEMYGLSSIGHSADMQPIIEVWKKNK